MNSSLKWSSDAWVAGIMRCTRLCAGSLRRTNTRLGLIRHSKDMRHPMLCKRIRAKRWIKTIQSTMSRLTLSKWPRLIRGCCMTKGWSSLRATRYSGTPNRSNRIKTMPTKTSGRFKKTISQATLRVSGCQETTNSQRTKWGMQTSRNRCQRDGKSHRKCISTRRWLRSLRSRTQKLWIIVWSSPEIN